MLSMTYDELMKQKSLMISSIEMDCTFQPVMNKNSTMICQQKGQLGSISEQLYNEAFDRKMKVQQGEEKALNDVMEQANKTKIDVNSQKLILQRKERYLHQFLKQCTTENKVSKDELHEMLHLVGIFQTRTHESRNSTKIELKKQKLLDVFWTLISKDDDEYVSDFIVFNFLIVLLETQLTTKQIKVLLTEVLKQKETDNLHENMDFVITEFKSFYDQNKLQIEQVMQIKNSTKKPSVQPQEIRFHPIICEKSKMIDMQTKLFDPDPCTNRYEQLFQQAKHLKEKKKELVEQSNLQKDDPECSFQPQINRRNIDTNEDEEDISCRLYNFASKFKSHKEELKDYYENQKAGKEMEECTFKPKTNNVQNIKLQPQVKGTQAVLDRQERARKMKYDKENYFVLRDQKLQDRDLTKVTKLEPFSMRAIQQDDRKVVVFVDVRISKTKKVRISLKEQDDPKQVAKNFARVHSLNQGMLATLEDMLIGYMTQFNKPLNTQ